MFPVKSKANPSFSGGAPRLRRYATPGHPQLGGGRRAAVRGSPDAMEQNRKDPCLRGDGPSTEACDAET